MTGREGSDRCATLFSLGGNGAEHLPPFASLPLLTGKFDEVGMSTTGVLWLTVRREIAHRPEWTAVG